MPVEADGGSGTRLSHWDETVFDTELMTGWYNSGETNPLSRITVASMADLGYQVNMAAADSYTRPTSSVTTSVATSSYPNQSNRRYFQLSANVALTQSIDNPSIENLLRSAAIGNAQSQKDNIGVDATAILVKESGSSNTRLSQRDGAILGNTLLTDWYHAAQAEISGRKTADSLENLWNIDQSTVSETHKAVDSWFAQFDNLNVKLEAMPA